MRFNPKRGLLLLLLWAFASDTASAQGKVRNREDADAVPQATRKNINLHEHPIPPRLLSPDEGSSVVGAALESHVRHRPDPDCSHLVHAIYGRAGFPYSYVRSSDLYVGIVEFRRVTHPQPGDLVIWLGHVGVVINPAQRSFYSALRSGPGVDFYDAPYWRERGRPRFYRYAKRSTTERSSKPRVAGVTLPTPEQR